MTLPAVTVLMSVYNGDAWLCEAVESILGQTFTGFEFFIIDDASTDASFEILARYADRDSRIRLFRNEASLGLAASLNECLPLVQTPYIARMDADDIALPSRFARQLHFLERHQEISVCGAWIECFGVSVGIGRRPVEHGAITASLLFFNPIAHPTVMARTAALQRVQYDPAFARAQDYELWSRMILDHGLRFHNLPVVLLRYRTHPSDYFLPWHVEILRRNVQRLGIKPSDRELRLHEALSLGRYAEAMRESRLEDVVNWLNTLFAASVATSLVATRMFEPVLQYSFLQCLSYAPLKVIWRVMPFVRFVSQSRMRFWGRMARCVLKKTLCHD